MLASRFAEHTVEEIANTVTHGFGLVLSVIGFAVLVVLSILHGGPLLVASCVVYGLSLVALYAASTIYHAVLSPELKRRLQIVDHCGIYLLIAGSYTPFGLIIIDSSVGRSLMIGIWAFAVIGILVKLVIRDRYPAISVISYLVMGWLGVVALRPLLDVVGMSAIVLLIASGISYSAGVIFFGWHRIPHNHAIFHVFILGGSILHYIAVVLYVIPSAAG